MTKIKWTNETWNPIIGCSKVSAGCKNCYAEKMAHRLSLMEKTEYYNNVVWWDKKNWGKWNGKTHFVESALDKPFRWKKPRMIFVCSMGDLFHESVSFNFIDEVFSRIYQLPYHTFQILTKRPERMKEYFDGCLKIMGNVWLGVTAENQEQANKRIPVLLQTPAKVRFVSVEPMLGDVDLNEKELICKSYSNGKLTIGKYLDWVICGGESGHSARPINQDWVRSLRDQCESANVPFFFKQWHKKSDGSLIDGKEYKQFPKSTKT